ncbi:MAG: 3-alpha,7-alpha,12-alpha-trihydroxy-5-beta-cholest-24-enoyl-CoA hydratase [Gammaproteobacteria bacterium]|jgi:acyl dehydratase|nr:3-alpha,7-alpha,12-alpha-trihydroxy-5-beta-cholest-24-enoyl-CoA hydratase [Gammaproteobacteria bacterium]
MLDYEKILNWQFAPVIQSYTKKDCILYALALGFGNNPTDSNELQYVYERNLLTFPTMAVALGHPGAWLSSPESGIDMTKVLHGAQSLEVFNPLPVEATIIAHTKVLDVIDKGVEKGAVLVTERKLYDQASNEHYCTQQAIIMARGNGGFGGSAAKVPAPHVLPERKPDTVIEIETSPQAALLYRLSGDYNPLHVDLELAEKLGFTAPILHGLASYGVAARAVLLACEINGADRLKSFELRFTSPVYPGETICTEIWKDNDVVSFRSKVKERDVVVLNNGEAVLKV